MSTEAETGRGAESLSGAMPPQFSELLGKVLANPEIINTVASALSQTSPPASKEDTAVGNDEARAAAVSANALPEGISDKLPELTRLLGPMLSGTSAGGDKKKEALLYAVRPYLSDGRRQAIDYMIRISRISEVLKNIN